MSYPVGSYFKKSTDDALLGNTAVTPEVKEEVEKTLTVAQEGLEFFRRKGRLDKLARAGQPDATKEEKKE